MSGIDFVADTNFLINLHEGHPSVIPFLDKTPVVSVISEIELLGWHKISESQKRKLKALLSDCILFELTTDIKSIAISLRQKHKIKVPDFIIAATSIYLQLPIVTSDQGFRNIKGIELVLL
jgi:predicted nucleic acid-binding protein